RGSRVPSVVRNVASAGSLDSPPLSLPAAGMVPVADGARGVVSPGRSTNRPPANGDPAFPPPPPPPPPPPGPNPKRCARPCTSPASNAVLIGSSCCALLPAFVNESKTTLMRETSHAESRFWDGESATGGGFLPWKFQTTRCSPAPAG